MSFGVPVRNGLGIGLRASTSLSTRGGSGGSAALYVEDVFSTWLYTGNGASQTITNGINVSGSGGLVWTKSRNDSGYWHSLCDTTRGAGNILATNVTDAQFSQPLNISGFTSTGFTVGNSFSNTSNYTFASWTFREAPKFFDVVTWTGNGTTQLISHNLGVTPGFVIYKATSTTSNWFTLARGSDGNYTGLKLNLNNQADFIGFPASTVGLTPTTFNPNAIYGNTDGVQYVAYLYAHDAASDGVIQCGSYTGNGSASGPVINLGWEPQWLMVKNASVANTNWQIIDNMRGMPVGSADATLQANLTNAESSVEYVSPTATGFQVTSGSAEVNTNASTYIYMAIRRGPMKVPTLGTSVFMPLARTGSNLPFDSGQTTAVTATSFAPDVVFSQFRSGNNAAFDKLRGGNRQLTFTGASAEVIPSDPALVSFSNTGYAAGPDSTYGYTNFSTRSYVNWIFSRAPGFFDEVCYTGTGSLQNVNHNLGVEPEMMIVKRRDGIEDWYATTTPFTSGHLILNLTNAKSAFNIVGSNPTSTTFAVQNAVVNGSGRSFVAYLFASAPGVSKVGSYTGNGSSQTINCAFTTGSRFVLIKRTDSTGDWYVWDSARGIVAGNDPYLAWNLNAAEVTTNDSVDTDSTGFVVNQVAASNINVNGATYIFLAIA